ncbi:MAG: hypothetical protein GWN21_17715 [Gammaproteobacteria bacterium]|nr:hypothetical protein [Gammaproteobacteria bacterium]NIP90165.1 hypothetical protein [Gammaproteobacteria bacterium]NIW57008.1 hypothetical protein [Gammaproteobacteria bacterium]NIX05988.1 hypothetical protein [Gammaproteobacteria bacterium]NIY01202.1 hypothetical protein [Gammaproteobacteria bacterium]
MQPGALQIRTHHDGVEAAATEVAEILENGAEQRGLAAESALPRRRQCARRGAGKLPACADQVLVEHGLDDRISRALLRDPEMHRRARQHRLLPSRYQHGKIVPPAGAAHALEKMTP